MKQGTRARFPDSSNRRFEIENESATSRKLFSRIAPPWTYWKCPGTNSTEGETAPVAVSMRPKSSMTNRSGSRPIRRIPWRFHPNGCDLSTNRLLENARGASACMGKMKRGIPARQHGNADRRVVIENESATSRKFRRESPHHGNVLHAPKNLAE